MSELASAPNTGLIGQRVGNYEIISKLGEGGMGAVYLGRHPLIGKKVAVKVLLEELVSNETIATRFFNEAKAANDIRHQNIVDVVDFGKIEKPGGGFVVYIMMEFLEGESLSARLKKGLLPVAATQHILSQCCSGLAASHAKGIIHRDLKPDNLFLIHRGNDDSFVKILDFGIAKLTVSAPTNAKTRTGTLIGTPAYMSPEQCSGRSNIDARSDIYSLGVVFYEMLTGRVPFEGVGFGDVVVGHLTENPTPPTQLRPDLPVEWEKIVLRALEKDPDKRFQTMEEMGLALVDPGAYAASPLAVAQAGAAAAAPTTSVPVVRDEPVTQVPTVAMGKATPQAPTQNETQPPTVMAKRPDTTLSGAASEVRPPPPKSHRGTVIAATAGAVIAVAAVVAMLGGKHGAPPAAPVVTPAPVVAPPSGTPAQPIAPAPSRPTEQVLVKLISNPPGAQVIRGDQPDAPLGVTPLTMKVDKGAPSFTVSLTLDGYKAETRTIATDANSDIEVSLAAAPKEVPKKRHVREAAPAAAPAAGDDEHKLLKPDL